MKLGTNIRNWGVTATPACIEACAKHADASTLDSIWLNDHIGLPPTLENNPYGISPDMAHMLDPLGVACFLAAVTSRIEFGIGVLILPYRPALPTLKWLATIQVLSRNRFLLGTGVGYLDEEFKALGVPKTKRGRINDEMLSLIEIASRSDTVVMNDQALVLKPRLPRPRIFIGGAPAVALDRAVRYGDGWMPVGMTPGELAPHVEELQSRAREAGRPAMEIVLMKTLPLNDPPAALELASAYARAGVTHLVHTQGVADPREFATVVDRLCGHVRCRLGQG
jgi:alkanesulfonate monooxygenase SsuD/methylene tetrahydromethanopterin reductase-like flavin-dependent oxidoreductase (luciferase family)